MPAGDFQPQVCLVTDEWSDCMSESVVEAFFVEDVCFSVGNGACVSILATFCPASCAAC